MMGKVYTYWSSRGGVGRTTLSLAKAYTLANEGNKVILLDFNEVSNHIHKLLGLKFIDPVGLFDDIEMDRGDIDKHFQDKYGITIWTGVDLNNFERFKIGHFAKIIDKVRGDYDYVIIDVNSGLLFSSVAASLKYSDVVYAVLGNTELCLNETFRDIEFVRNYWGIGGEKFKYINNKIIEGSKAYDKIRVVLGEDVRGVYYDKDANEIQERGKIYIPKEMRGSKKPSFLGKLIRW